MQSSSKMPQLLRWIAWLHWYNSASWDLLLCLRTFGYYGKGEGISSPITWWSGEVRMLSAGCLGLWTIVIVYYVMYRYDMITIYIMQCRFDTMVLSRKFLVLIQLWSRWNGVMEWPCTQTNPLWMGAHGCDWVSAVVCCFCRRSKLQHFLARYQRFRIHFMEIFFLSHRILAFLLLPCSKMFERKCAISLFGCMFSTFLYYIYFDSLANFPYMLNSSSLTKILWTSGVGQSHWKLHALSIQPCFNQTFPSWAQGPIDWSGVSGRMLFGCSTVTWCCNFKPKFWDWHWRKEQVCSELAHTLSPLVF